MNELIATGPFDLYELQLFHLVAEHRSFTRAAAAAGLTQSAVTRQIAGMEDRLGAALFERTTRSVRLTPAGAALYARSGTILANVDSAIHAVRERFRAGPSLLRVGIARTVGLSYLPGFFRRFRQTHPTVQLRVNYESSAFILGAIESGELDIGLVTASARRPAAVAELRRFADEFVCILPPAVRLPKGSKPWRAAKIAAALPEVKWLLLTEQSITGRMMREWLKRQRVKVEVAMEADDFDLMINLVALGVGAAFVPYRALPLHIRTHPVQRVATNPKFVRELLVVCAKGNEGSALAKGFLEALPFGLLEQAS